MKRSKMFVVLSAIVMLAMLASGCIAVELDVNSNGSAEMRYVIDMSQLGGMMTVEELKTSIEESVGDMNDEAGKDIAKLKEVKEDKKAETLTAIITLTDLNKLGEEFYFGSVADFQKEGGSGLDNMVSSKNKAIDESDISEKLNMVLMQMEDTGEYGLITVTVKVPGTVEYMTNGAELVEKDTVMFSGQNPLVIYKGGSSLPIVPIVIVVGVLIVVILIFSTMKKKKAAPQGAYVPQQGMPQQPMQQPQQPMQGMPQQPMQGMPQQPIQGMPQQPMQGMPQQPMQQPQQPMQAMPQQPVEQPQQPAAPQSTDNQNPPS